MIIQSSNTLRTSTDLFLSDHLLATFLEQSSKQLMMLIPLTGITEIEMDQGYPFVPYHLDAS